MQSSCKAMVSSMEAEINYLKWAEQTINGSSHDSEFHSLLIESPL